MGLHRDHAQFAPQEQVEWAVYELGEEMALAMLGIDADTLRAMRTGEMVPDIVVQEHLSQMLDDLEVSRVERPILTTPASEPPASPGPHVMAREVPVPGGALV